VRGAPLCAMGPLAKRALPGEMRAYGAPCEGCAARSTCVGVDEKYLARFGSGELTTLAVRPAGSDASPAVARMFVGVGEMSGLAEDRRSVVDEAPGDAPGGALRIVD